MRETKKERKQLKRKKETKRERKKAKTKKEDTYRCVVPWLIQVAVPKSRT